MLAFSSAAHASTVWAASRRPSVSVRSNRRRWRTARGEAPAMEASEQGGIVARCAASSARFSPGGDADAHHGRAGVLHDDGADVGEVEVDKTRNGDEVRDAPRMPWRSVYRRRCPNASSMLVFLSTISSRRSFGMTMSVSTFCDSKADALLSLIAGACDPRRRTAS